MLFNSAIFFVFLPIVLGAYYCLSRRYQNLWLLGASYFFYGYWDWRFLGLLLLSTVVDFCIGHSLERTEVPRRRKLLLSLSVATNLGLLGTFKYFGFFVSSLTAMLGSFGLVVHPPILDIVLPVGISFYTFQTLSYTIDVYRGRIGACRDPLAFALFVSFFPQLVAGPIERASSLLPQLQHKRQLRWQGIAVGLELMLLGYLKKVGIADTLAPYLNLHFNHPDLASGSELLLSAYLFSFQIYCDFSGYSDIARGIAKLMGIDLMRNFNQPYLSRSITEFWRRWHVSLSTWLRDYVYISLGGNRKRSLITYRNLMLTMLLGGLWHGASWTFVAWGGLHGIYLAVHKLLLGRRGLREPPAAQALFPFGLLKILLTFHLVTFTWIFFRAGSFADAATFLEGIFSWQASVLSNEIPFPTLRVVLLLGLLVAIDVTQAVRGHHAFMVSWGWASRALAYAGIGVIVFLFGNVHGNVPFIYFQF